MINAFFWFVNSETNFSNQNLNPESNYIHFMLFSNAISTKVYISKGYTVHVLAIPLQGFIMYILSFFISCTACTIVFRGLKTKNIDLLIQLCTYFFYQVDVFSEITKQIRIQF
jgi:hypothetical protein